MSDLPLHTGTGSLIKVNKQIFILTCEHVVKRGYKAEKIKFLYRDEHAIQWGSRERILHTPINILTTKLRLTFPVELPIVNRFYANDDCDLVLLELDASYPLFEKYNFFNLNLNIDLVPKKDCQVYFMGFSTELFREVKKKAFGCFPYFANSIIVDKRIDVIDFDPDKHFLIDYDFEDERAEPKGLSGCGIWSRMPSGEGNIWTPNLRLVGIQTGVYRKYNVLKATKIEKIIDLLNTSAIPSPRV